MIEVLQSVGLHTIQDIGRTGFQSYGIPVSGPMDKDAFEVANYLCGNDRNSPAIELSTGKLILKFSDSAIISVIGFAETELNEIKIPPRRLFRVKAHDILIVTQRGRGNFAYIAASGGWKANSQLGSSSTYLTLKIGKAIKSGDILHSGTCALKLFENRLQKLGKSYPDWGVSDRVLPNYSSNVIRIIPGKEMNYFSHESIQNFITDTFQTGNEKNRMGFVLKDAHLTRINEKEMTSVPVQKGTIQVTPDNFLYILMADAQTIGGYPRIGQVAAVDLPILSQKRSNESFRFEWIQAEDAIRLLRTRDENMNRLKSILERKFLS